MLLPDTTTLHIYPLSLHDALPICQVVADSVRPGRTDRSESHGDSNSRRRTISSEVGRQPSQTEGTRSEEHTSELQSHSELVCRLLLEKKKIEHLLKVLRDRSEPIE